MKNLYVALEDLRSLYNIGAIFRTCSFFGVKNVLLVGYSGKTQKGSEIVLHPNVLKSSLGAEKDLNITFINTTSDLIKFAKDNELNIVSVEQHEKSIPIEKWQPKDNTLVVFGNEVNGISTELLAKSTEIVEISRAGNHNSLNVTTACGIILYQFFTT